MCLPWDMNLATLLFLYFSKCLNWIPCTENHKSRPCIPNLRIFCLFLFFQKNGKNPEKNKNMTKTSDFFLLFVGYFCISWPPGFYFQIFLFYFLRGVGTYGVDIKFMFKNQIRCNLTIKPAYNHTKLPLWQPWDMDLATLLVVHFSKGLN